MPLQLVLAIDYSRAALTTTLLVEEAALFDVQRVIRNASLGANDHSRMSVAPPDYWESIRAQLRYVTRMAISDPYVVLPVTISQLVLLGDRATDPQLADAIKNVMGSSVLQTAPPLGSDADAVGPVFAAALGEAALSKFKLDLGEGDCEPACIEDGECHYWAQGHQEYPFDKGRYYGWVASLLLSHQSFSTSTASSFPSSSLSSFCSAFAAALSLALSRISSTILAASVLATSVLVLLSLPSSAMTGAIRYGSAAVISRSGLYRCTGYVSLV